MKLNKRVLNELSDRNGGKFLIIFDQLEKLNIQLKELMILFKEQGFDVEDLRTRHCYLALWNIEPKAIIFGRNQIVGKHELSITEKEILELFSLNTEIKYLI